MKRALLSDTLVQPRLKQHSETGSEIRCIFETLFVRHIYLIHYHLRDLTNIHITYITATLHFKFRM